MADKEPLEGDDSSLDPYYGAGAIFALICFPKSDRVRQRFWECAPLTVDPSTLLENDTRALERRLGLFARFRFRQHGTDI